MAINSYILSILHTIFTFVLSFGSYWSSLASKFQFQNVTKGLDWLPAGYYTLPVADEMYFAGMKTPLHLGILVLEDTYCLASVALIISLAYSIGTRQFSVYARGLTQKDYLTLQRNIEQLLNDKVNHKLDITVRHILSSSAAEADSRDSLNVHMVNPGDGKKLVVDVTKHIAQLIRLGKVTQEEITPEYIDALLSKKIQCADPDLVLNFGPVPTTGGYLPWQLRLAEIVSMSSLKTFTPAKMKSALMRFSRIEQRFGK